MPNAHHLRFFYFCQRIRHFSSSLSVGRKRSLWKRHRPRVWEGGRSSIARTNEHRVMDAFQRCYSLLQTSARHLFDCYHTTVRLVCMSDQRASVGFRTKMRCGYPITTCFDWLHIHDGHLENRMKDKNRTFKLVGKNIKNSKLKKS